MVSSLSELQSVLHSLGKQLSNRAQGVLVATRNRSHGILHRSLSNKPGEGLWNDHSTTAHRQYRPPSSVHRQSSESAIPLVSQPTRRGSLRALDYNALSVMIINNQITWLEGHSVSGLRQL